MKIPCAAMRCLLKLTWLIYNICENESEKANNKTQIFSCFFSPLIWKEQLCNSHKTMQSEKINWVWRKYTQVYNLPLSVLPV